MYDRVKMYWKKNPYDHKGTDGYFVRAVKRNVAYHRKHCNVYNGILHKKRFYIRDVRKIEDLARIPLLTTQYLKRHHLMSMDFKYLPVKAASSGTSGRQSLVGLDIRTLLFCAVMTIRMISYHHIGSWKPVNYLVLGYEPHKSNQTMISKTQNVTTYFAPPRYKEYALKYRKSGYEIDYNGMLSALKRYEKKKSPVRLVGLPAYVFFLLTQLQKENHSFRFPKGSMVLLGGGWKEFDSEKIEKERLFRLIKERLGIPEEHCREFFGVTEHPVLYCSCPNHHFHVPNYSRILIRDVQTLRPVENGVTGLVNLITPAADSMPLTSIMTDDLGILRDGGECGCGIETPYLELVGRAGVKDIVTCSTDAADFLRNGR